MKGDFTRSTFNPKKHYSGVRMQQGRVQLDADWNEQVDIDTHRDLTTTRDTVGASGVPVLPDGTSSGFKVTLPGIGANASTFTIRGGRMYVDGVLCVNEADVDYSAQPDYAATAITVPVAEADRGLRVVYLDTWERHISALEDPEIREVALGGPDTATRTKTVWQVKMLKIGPASAANAICSSTLPEWDALVAASTGTLNVQTAPAVVDPSTDPCIVAAEGGYRGLENQLYRVEIHKLSAGVVTYKWSRDNGAFLFGVESVFGNGTMYVLSSLGRDENSTLNVNDWVEIQSRRRELAGLPGTLAKVTAIDTVDRYITVQAGTDEVALSTYAQESEGMITVRRWDFKNAGLAVPTTQLAQGAQPQWITLENGVQVKFVPGPGGAYADGTYRTGDHWIVPARIATQDVEWPQTDGGTPIEQPPMGIKHRYARLALVNIGANGFERATLKDCRKTFLSLADIPTLGFHFVGGDGQEASPGATLPRLLQVSVTERGRKVVGARVRFVVKIGNGRIKPIVDGVPAGSPEVEVIAETDVNGVASCEFTLDEVNASQQVEAVLLGEQDIPLTLNPVRFNASFTSSGTVFSYVCGDGQDGLPSTYLPVPLTVGVNEFGRVRAGAKVEFRITLGSGLLRGYIRNGNAIEMVTGTRLVIPTGEDGIASVEWQLDGTTRNQRVESRLLDADEAPLSITPICFNANIGSDLEFLYVGGDGQEGLPASTLTFPLEVGVMNGQVKLQGARVRFTVTQGGGQIASPTTSSTISPQELIADTNVDGIAAVKLTLDQGSPAQQVTAVLLSANNEQLEFTPIHFNATLSQARGVAYLPPTGCEKFTGATTVQAALDALCACDCGTDCPPVIRVTGVYFATASSANGAPLNPYATVTLNALQYGLRIVTDTEIDPAAVKPCSVFADAHFPYPVQTTDRDFWGLDPINANLPFDDQFLGTRPIGMMANVSVDLVDKHVIRWVPSQNMLDKFQEMFTTIGHSGAAVPVKLAIKGSSIWSEGNTRVLLAGNASFGGNVLSVPDDRDCDEPSDFIFCFVMVKNPATPCPKITSVVFDGPVIGGSTLTGHLHFETPISTEGTLPQLKLTSKVTSVIEDTGLVLTPHPAPSQTVATHFSFTVPTTEVATATTVQLTVENAEANDPCKRSITTVITVGAKPCSGISTTTFNSPVVGDMLEGTITFAPNNQAVREFSITSSNQALIPNPGSFSVPVNANSLAVSIETLDTNPEPITTITPVTLSIADPCDGSVRNVVVNVKPVPCEKILRFDYVPVVGGAMASYTVTFDRPLTASRQLTFQSSNTNVLKNKTYTFTPVSNQLTYVVPSVETVAVTTDTEVIVSVDPCGEVVTRRVVVLKRPCVEIVDFVLPTELIGGENLNGTIKLAANVSYAQHVQFVVDSANVSVIEPGPGVDFAIGEGTVAKNFTLVTHTLAEPRDIMVRAILCDREIVRWVRVNPLPCEYPQDYIQLPQPLTSGVLYTPAVYLSGEAHTNAPINVTFVPPVHAPIEVPVAVGEQMAQFDLTFTNITEDVDVEIVADRCGRSIRLRRRVLRQHPDVPRIKTVTVMNPINPSYSVQIEQPGVPALVDVRQLGFEQYAGPLQVRLEFCGTLPAPATVTGQTFQITYHDLNAGTNGMPIPADVTFEGGIAICTMPVEALGMGFFSVVVKGEGPGLVMASSAGNPLDGEFSQQLNGVNCTGSTGDTLGSNFVGYFRLYDGLETPGGPGAGF